MQKDDNVPQAGDEAGNSTKAEATFGSSNDAKPNVVGLPSLSVSKVSQWARCVWLAITGQIYTPSLNKSGSGYTSTGEGVQSLG